MVQTQSECAAYPRAAAARPGYRRCRCINGAVLTLSPLPFGAPLMAGGLALMSSVDRTCRRAMIGARKKSGFFNKIIFKSGSVLPTRARKVIGLTDPQTYKPDPDVKAKEQ